jgi:DUF971 family protein
MHSEGLHAIPPYSTFGPASNCFLVARPDASLDNTLRSKDASAVDVVDVEIAEGGYALAIVAADGRRRCLTAALLWSECPSAQGRVRRARGESTAPDGIAIAAVSEIGSYGVNIAFSDGHDRGIYPWSYLSMLAQRPQLDDFLIA